MNSFFQSKVKWLEKSIGPISGEHFLLIEVVKPFGLGIEENDILSHLDTIGIDSFLFGKRIAFLVLSQKEERTGILFKIALWGSNQEIELKNATQYLPSNLKFIEYYASLAKSANHQNILAFAYEDKVRAKYCFYKIQKNELTFYVEEPSKNNEAIVDRFKVLSQYWANSSSVDFKTLSSEFEYFQSLGQQQNFIVPINLQWPKTLNFLWNSELAELKTKGQNKLMLKFTALVFSLLFLFVLGLELTFFVKQKKLENQFKENPEINELNLAQTKNQKQLDSLIGVFAKVEKLNSNNCDWSLGLDHIASMFKDHAKWKFLKAYSNTKSIEVHFETQNWDKLEEVEKEKFEFGPFEKIEIIKREENKDSKINFIVEGVFK